MSIEATEKFISFEKITDGLIWLYVVLAAGLYRFFKWFFVREYQNFAEINKKLQKELHKMNDRLTSIEDQFGTYKARKHEIENENAALTGSMIICKDALEIAERIIQKSKKHEQK